MVEVSPYFTKLASSRDTDQLLAMLPYKSMHLSSVKDRFGIYALVGKNENRDKGILQTLHFRPQAAFRNKAGRQPEKGSGPQQTTRNGGLTHEFQRRRRKFDLYVPHL